MKRVNQMRYFFLSLFMLFISCNKICLITPSKVWLEKISWSAHKDANEGMPVKVHLIYFYDEEYMKKITDKESSDYFENYETLKQDFGNKVELYEFDVVPGRAQDNIKIKPQKCDAKGAIIFARYNSSKKSQRYNIGEDSEVRLIFKKDTIEIIEGKD